jgi:hypothetical protein
LGRRLLETAHAPLEVVMFSAGNYAIIRLVSASDISAIAADGQPPVFGGLQPNRPYSSAAQSLGFIGRSAASSTP